MQHIYLGWTSLVSEIRSRPRWSLARKRSSLEEWPRRVTKTFLIPGRPYRGGQRCVRTLQIRQRHCGLFHSGKLHSNRISEPHGGPGVLIKRTWPPLIHSFLNLIFLCADLHLVRAYIIYLTRVSTVCWTWPTSVSICLKWETNKEITLRVMTDVSNLTILVLTICRTISSEQESLAWLTVCWRPEWNFRDPQQSWNELWCAVWRPAASVSPPDTLSSTVLDAWLLCICAWFCTWPITRIDAWPVWPCGWLSPHEQAWTRYSRFQQNYGSVWWQT